MVKMNLQQKILGLNTNFLDPETFEFNYDHDCGCYHYHEFYESNFSCNISLLDYDAVVIGTKSIAKKYKTDNPKKYKNKRLLSKDDSIKIIEDFNRVREQLIFLLENGKNVFLLMENNKDCYIYNGKEELIGIKLSGDLKDEVMIFDTYSFLPIDINVNHINGSQIEFCHKQPYMNFFKQVSDYIHYYSYFESPKNL